MFIGIAPIVVALVSTAVSVAANALIGALAKPKGENPKGRIPGSAIGRAIPEGFNTFVLDDIMWVEPASEDRAFEYKTRRRQKEVYLTAIGALAHCKGGAKISHLWVSGEKSYSEGGGLDFIQQEVDFNEGLPNQLPFQNWINEYGINNLCAYRNIVTLGFYSLGVHKRGRNNSFPGIRTVLKSNITYSVGDIIKKKRWTQVLQSQRLMCQRYQVRLFLAIRAIAMEIVF